MSIPTQLPIVDRQFEYFMTLYKECRRSRRYYKHEQNRILYWLGGGFIALMAASGILGALDGNAATLNFKPGHLIVFHALFLILFLYLLYKQINVDIFQRTTELLGEYIILRFGIDYPEYVPKLARLRNSYLSDGNFFTKPKLLPQTANVAIVLLYIGLVIYPILNIKMQSNQLVIDQLLVLSLTIFTVIIVGGWLFYHIQRKRILGHIEKDWHEALTVPSTKHTYSPKNNQ